MTDPQAVGLSAVVWFAVGGAVLTAIGRGPQYAVTIPGRAGVPTPPEIAARLVVWIGRCVIWPHTLFRWARGFGEFHGHLAPDCEHRILAGSDPSRPWDLYRHGRACRRRTRDHVR